MAVSKITFATIDLFGKDMLELGTEGYLNDSMLDFAVRLAARTVGCTHFCQLQTHFYTNLTTGKKGHNPKNGEIGWENVKNWTRKLPKTVFEYEAIGLMVNEQRPLPGKESVKVPHWWMSSFWTPARLCAMMNPVRT